MIISSVELSVGGIIGLSSVLLAGARFSRASAMPLWLGVVSLDCGRLVEVIFVSSGDDICM